MKVERYIDTQIDRQMDGWTDGWIYEQVNDESCNGCWIIRYMDEWIHGQMKK